LSTIGLDSTLSKSNIFDIYGRSVSVIPIIIRLTSIIKNYSEEFAFKEFNLSFSGFTVMWVIWVRGDLETAKLAKNAGIAKSTLSGILKTLEKHGYCKRIPHSSDARRVVVHITKAGEELMEKIFPKFHEIEDIAISGLTDKEFETTIDSFRTMLNTMEDIRNRSR
jgi:DNA-binding MarR family transcriptional regulator